MSDPRNVVTKLSSGEPLRSLGWASLGFVLGAAFWHAIGFWDFVGNVVLNGPSDRRRIAAEPSWRADVRADPSPARPLLTSRRAAAAVPTPSPTCNLLHLDRQTGMVALATCPTNSPEMASGTLGEKADRLQVGNTTLQPEITADYPNSRPAAIASMLSQLPVSPSPQASGELFNPTVPLAWPATVRGPQP
jgi:hypothetical protein